MDLNVKSPFFLTQALHGALMKAATAERPAKVINIASIDGIRLNPWETYSYHASKASLLYLTRRMAARLIKDHIVVTAIAPGPFASEMNKMARDHADAVAARTPAGRIGRGDLPGVARGGLCVRRLDRGGRRHRLCELAGDVRGCGICPERDLHQLQSCASVCL
jgi:NAD(P)-dependent dehydrogenase (short-subunit alcohol dehydrogenase family)